MRPDKEIKSLIKVFLKFKKKKKILNLHEPTFSGSEKRLLSNCVNTTFVSTVGSYIDKFEAEISNYTKSKYVIATNSGTSALHICLEALSIDENCEIMVPAVTFVGTVNAILYTKATPHFIDCNKQDPNIDLEKLEKYLYRNYQITKSYSYNKKTKKILKAIIPVHVFGHPVDMEKLQILAKKFKIDIIEDAAEGIGSFYKKKHVGTLGNFGVISFNGNKTITTGSGGVILTSSKKFYLKMKHISSTSKIKKKWSYVHDEKGYNYRMNNISAALGCAQMSKLEKFIKKKRELFNFYKKSFEKFNSFEILKEPKDSRSNYWLQAIILKKNNYKKRDKYLSILHKNGIKARPIWNLMNSLKFLKKYPKMNLSNSRSLEKRLINLPSSAFLIK